MRRKVSSVILLFVLLSAGLLLPQVLHAQVGQWQALYWTNTTFGGEPELVRTESQINHEWGTGSPAPGIPADRFSARWTGTFAFEPGRYRFTVTVDDGARLWVNNQLIIDEWTVQSEQIFTADVTLPGGNIPIRLDYFENTGVALIRLDWTRIGNGIDDPALPAGFWRGEYFNNRSLSGLPALLRNDANINFSWGQGSPEPNIIDVDNFSVRWTRSLNLPAGRYRFTVTVDDGVRLWVNNQLIIDEWQTQSATTYSAEVDLPGGSVPVRMEYFEAEGNAVAQLSWTRLTAAPPAAPPPAPPPAEGAPVNVWRGEYFNNPNLAGEPALVRHDPQLNFNWRLDSPEPNVIDPDRFSVRWTRTLSLASGRYEFTVRVDDGVRLWVDGRRIIDQWRAQPLQTFTAQVDVTGGATPVRVEYFEDAGEARIEVTWRRIGDLALTPTQPVVVPPPAVPPPAVPPPAVPPPAAPVATVTGAYFLNVRSGPGVQFPPLAVVAGGQTVTMLGRSPATGWIQIQLPDWRAGWVNGRYLAPSVPFTNLPVTG
ncbi:MAG: hypothetical protein DCC55_32335 [Chloroflexi bacterium]|nr:MAG: hypothetical protein DCC55_32335 [Chloroflexota bacterium]